MSEFYLIAEIKAASDIEGYALIYSYSDFIERFAKLKKVFIDIYGAKREFFVEDVNYYKSDILIKFRNFDTNEDLISLIGRKVYVDSDNVVKLPEDTYFVHDLIESSVFEGDKQIGVLKDVLSLSCHDVYVIYNANNEEILIPAVKEYIEKYDVQNKILYVKPGYDLYYDDED